MDLVQLILRSLQLLFVAIVLGLSAGLVVNQVVGGSPASTNYVLFCGIWGAIVLIVGFAAVFIHTLQGLIMLVLDGLAVVVFVIGGVIYAVKLGVHSCGNDRYAFNPITNGGSRIEGNTITTYGKVQKLCHMAQADTAFLFFALAAFIGSLVMDLVAGFRGGARKGRSSRRNDSEVEEYET